MPNTVERYTLAVQSPNMRVNPDRPTSMDYLIAAGMVWDGPGLIFMRVRSEFDGSCGKVSMSSLESAFRALNSELRHITNEPPARIAQAVLAWWLDPSCSPCGGSGVVKSAEYPMGKVCLQCRGTRFKKLPYGGVGRALTAFIESSMAESSDQMNGVLHRRRQRGKIRA